MSQSPPEPAGSHPEESNLSTTYILVLAIEVVVIAGLYWLGRHFG